MMSKPSARHSMDETAQLSKGETCPPTRMGAGWPGVPGWPSLPNEPARPRRCGQKYLHNSKPKAKRCGRGAAAVSLKEALHFETLH